jgi:hypothetical protein
MPCDAGPAGWEFADLPELDDHGVEVAASAIAAPPMATAPTAAPVASIDLMFLICLSLVVCAGRRHRAWRR